MIKILEDYIQSLLPEGYIVVRKGSHSFVIRYSFVAVPYLKHLLKLVIFVCKNVIEIYDRHTHKMLSSYSFSDPELFDKLESLILKQN